MRRGPKRLYIARSSLRSALDGGVNGNGAQFVNHGCDPNLFSRRRNGRIFFYSRKAIGKGQELTIDYWMGPTPEPIPCRCGARRCRGIINHRRKRRFRRS